MNKYDDGFVTTCKALDEGVQTINLQKMKIEKLDTRVSFPGIGSLSPRAQKNLGKWLSISQGLMREMTAPVLNDMIHEQLVRRSYTDFRVGMNPDGTNEVVFLQPVGIPYLKLSEILDPISKSIIGINGNPVTDDVLRILTGEGKITPNDGHDLIVGQQLNISAISTIKPLSMFAAYRIVCSNGMISATSTSSYKIETQGASAKFLAEILKMRNTEVAKWSKELEAFAKDASQKQITVDYDSVMLDIQNSNLFPQTVVNECNVMKAKVDKGESDLSKVGIAEFATVWNYVNFLTFMAQVLPSGSSRETTEKGALTWGRQKINSI